MHILYFVLTLREVKIMFQTVTASGTSKPPVPHLFYFCFSFPTFPCPVCICTALWTGGTEENTPLTQRGRPGRARACAGLRVLLRTAGSAVVRTATPPVTPTAGRAEGARHAGESGTQAGGGGRADRPESTTSAGIKPDRQSRRVRKQEGRRQELPLCHSWS